MVKGKPSKDRPRSSANRRKKAGSPDGSDTPIENQLVNLDSYQQPPIIDVIRGPTVDNLQIAESDMLALRPEQAERAAKEKKVIEVRKKKVISNAPTKTVTVLKKVSKELPEVAIASSGPRYNAAGEILSYSLLGPVEEFKQATAATGFTGLIDKPVFQAESRAPRPILVEQQDPEPIETGKEGHALQNWEKQLRAHSQQMSQLSNKVGRSPSSLLMNRTREFRVKQEERSIIDRAIPALDRGKGYRVGSEFWSQPQYIGDPDSAIVMTLNQSEQGKFPEIEKIGLPNWKENMSQGHLYPWKRNKFFEKRRRDLDDVITEQEPFHPEFDGLCIVGKRELAPAKVATPVPSVVRSDPPSRPETPRCGPLINSGPRLEINGQPCKWGSEVFEPTVVRMLFSEDAGAISTQQMTLKNTGTTAIFFAWKLIPKENTLHTIMEGNKQRFYFSINDGVILPGQELSMPFIFLSKQAGIYTESWQFISKPVLNNGSPIVVTLRGVALKRDLYKEEKHKIETMLEKRQVQYNMSLLVEELVRGIHSPPPPAPPTPPGPSVEEKFNASNPYLHYQSDYYAETEALWAEVAPEGGAWDETVASLRKAVLALPLEEQPEKMAKFSALRQKMTQPRLKPSSTEVYDLCYGCLRAAIDGFEVHDKSLRAGLGIGERVHVEEPAPAEPDTTSEKTATALISPAPDSKKGKKTSDAEKKKDTKASKDKGKPTSKGGKKSEAALIPDDEDLAPKKEWLVISDPVLAAKYSEKLHILAHNVLAQAVDQISLALEEELRKGF